MLIQFRVKNFKSFRDEQLLSLVASTDSDLPDNTSATQGLKKMRLVNSAVIYGANASGKSNLIDALAFMRNFVNKSAESRPDSDIPVNRFRLDLESQQQPTEFEIIFIHETVRYEYGFSVDNKRVQDEWLIAYPKGAAQTWFERPTHRDATEEDWYFGRHLKGEKNKLIPLTRPNVLFLSIGAKFNNPQLYSVYQWFTAGLDVVDSVTPALRLEFMTIERLLKNPDLWNYTQLLLKMADLGIINFSLKEEAAPFWVDVPDDASERMKDAFSFFPKINNDNSDDDTEPTQVTAIMQHQVHDEDTMGVGLGLDEESLGTRQLFGLSSLLFASLQVGSVLVIDELDTSLHPTLVRQLIAMFHHPQLNPHGAQLIFNTHDTTLLDLSLFRRDQIWFVEKDNCGASHLYPLLDFKPRKAEAVAKGYLQGRYGAIPFLGNIAELLGDGS